MFLNIKIVLTNYSDLDLSLYETDIKIKKLDECLSPINFLELLNKEFMNKYSNIFYMISGELGEGADIGYVLFKLYDENTLTSLKSEFTYQPDDSPFSDDGEFINSSIKEQTSCISEIFEITNDILLWWDNELSIIVDKIEKNTFFQKN